MIAIRDAKLQTDPYKFLYADNCFAPEVYSSLLDRMKSIPDKAMKQFDAYPARRAMVVDLPEVFGPDFKSMVLEKFRAKGESTELRYVRDRTGYSIPPHTDSPSKVISLLFYLAEDKSLIDYGTSVYVPKKAGFKCEQGLHHKFESFRKVLTAPFLPNTCFGFQRSDVSFHGVEPIGNVTRNVLLYNIYR